MTSDANVSSFYRNELSRALQEQQDAIASYRLLASSSTSATAEVELLEKRVMTLSLSLRGYRFIGDDESSGSYESLDALLESVSPLCAGRKREALHAKLAELAAGSKP